ncbi:MAG TPA: cytochrome c biogenesis protein CcdA [Anaeromyxobacter sp.]|nr:cytochrome c biogenesis protein CcdA [Anaeromyxobacter sp.]
MRLAVRLALALAAFGVVAYLPDLFSAGVTGPSGDLGLGALLGRGSLLAFGAAFAGGVLTSLTPCVYPLIPITVSIFGAKRAGSRAQAMGLSALYVLGIAVMYSALGLAAALSGAAFGSVMQSPWVMGLVGLVLANLALSMFGLFELQLPSSWQARLSRVGGAGYAGSFAMGLVSGIIAAPCTGPVLAAALAFVAASGSVALGVTVMFAYALGLGLLFFLIGAFSLSLPRSGPWMETVKSVFGVALLTAGLVFLLGAFPGLRGAFSAARAPVLLAAGLAALGVLAGALTASFGARPLVAAAKAFGLLLLVGGLVYGIGAGGARERARAAASFAWMHDYDAAVQRARAEGKPMILDFWAEWCAACKELDRTVWADPRVRAEAARFVAVKIDGTEYTDTFDAIAAKKYAVPGLPTVIFLDARGREAPQRVLGAVDPEEMIEALRTVDGACEDAPEPPPPPRVPGAVVACAVRW